MNTKVTILSPHCDDAAYSLTLTISRLLNNHVSIDLINCFTLSNWTAVPVPIRQVPEISRLRASEDTAFNKLLGSPINFINLGFLDAPLRNNYIIQFKPLDAGEWNLVEELRTRLETKTDQMLLCPLGIGRHIDHSICLEAVLGLYKKTKVIFFEDLPYAARIGYEELLLHIKSIEDRLMVKILPYINQLQKCAVDKEVAIRLYESQMNEEICSEILSHMKALQGERLWGEPDLLDELKNKLSC